MDPTQQVWEIKPPFPRTKFYVLFKFPGNPKGRGYLEKSPLIGGTCLCSFDLSSTGQQSNLNAFFVAAVPDFGFLGGFFSPRRINLWKSLLLEMLVENGPELLCLRN